MNQLAARLRDLGCSANVDGSSIEVDIDGNEIVIAFDDSWVRAITSYYRARQYSFDVERRVLNANWFAEYQLTRLDPGYFYRSEHKFKDRNGCEVHLAPASKEFQLAYFSSDRYSVTFERVRDRITRRCEMRRGQRRRANRVPFRPDQLFFAFYTAKYTVPRKPRNKTVGEVACDRVRACLFSLAALKGECWEISHDIKSRGLLYPQYDESDDTELDIPQVTYEPSVVSYYKVAKSSQFPSQVFLSYYHILEYYFLRVADESLYSAVSSSLNDPSFVPSYDNVSSLVATIKRNDNTNDEKKMLREVLDRYVPEEDYIEYVKQIESDRGEKIFTGSKQKIFGEQFSIKLEKGHAIANTATLLKHIRNALVHSSDRYSRDDCFLPFSESEEIVVKYIPLVQFMAEKVIFSTARC
ncbi:MAG: hypothetical protein ACSHXK_12650 [Oceanococcus sp.]